MGTAAGQMMNYLFGSNFFALNLAENGKEINIESAYADCQPKRTR